MTSNADLWLEHEGFRFVHRVQWHPAPEFAPTLFAGGAFMNMDSWVRFQKAFAPHTTVVLVDPVGIGASDFLPPDYPAQFLSHCLARVIEQVASTIGIALRGDREFMAQEMIRGLLNRRDPNANVERQALAERVLRSNIMKLSDDDLVRYAANTERLLRHGCVDLSVPVRGPEALVFTGEYDDFTRPVECLEVASAFERARITTVRRADHIFNIEQYETVRDLLFWFMRGAEEEPPAGCNAIEYVGACDQKRDAPSPASRVASRRWVPGRLCS